MVQVMVGPMERELRWGGIDGLLRSWKFQEGSRVKEGDVLALVEPVSIKLISPVSGTLMSCLVRNNTKIQPEYVLVW